MTINPILQCIVAAASLLAMQSAAAQSATCKVMKDAGIGAESAR